MKIGHSYERFRQDVRPAMKSKIEEFSLLGYDTISETDLWKYLTQKKWRKPKEEVHLYEIVSDILSVQISEYMNYASLEAYKMPDFSFGNEDELKELLK